MPLQDKGAIEANTIVDFCPTSDKPRSLPNATCTYSYEKRQSCNNAYGSWLRTDVDANYKSNGCLSSKGCKVEKGIGIPTNTDGPDLPNLPERFFCTGEPECGAEFKNPLLCRIEERCVFNPGFKLFASECRQIFCEGQYVKGESWVVQKVREGVKFKECVGPDRVYSYVVCNPGHVWDGFGCYTSIP